MATKDQLIATIVTNGCGCFQDGDQEILGNFDNVRLQSIVKSAENEPALELAANAATLGFEDPAGNKHAFVGGEWYSDMVENSELEGKTPPTPVTAPTTNAAPQTIDTWFASAPPEVQSVVRNAMAREDAEKLELIGKLTANASDEQKKKLLPKFSQLSISDLQDLVGLIPVQNKAAEAPISAWFGNQPGIVSNSGPAPKPAATTTSTDDDILELPTINWGSEA